jgi:uncharacterized membrane protein
MTEPAVLPRQDSPADERSLRKDTLAMVLVVLPILLMVALFLWLGATYNSLPDLLPLHFDAQGNPDRIEERGDIFVLPIIGLITNVVNVGGGLLLRQRFNKTFAPYLLWSGALLVQVLIWIAIWNITQ